MLIVVFTNQSEEMEKGRTTSEYSMDRWLSLVYIGRARCNYHCETFEAVYQVRMTFFAIL